ncbi:Geranylgeranylglycerol-phosphate geranylgeranyltransferase [groundwater metagenome]|uniref:Geranylgeranylglycerol-phosphate geranylgeranyltransferase n=1 Tax=groundwater metagenome TaxID=717931 RepID=A0A098E753_9ZZZZ
MKKIMKKIYPFFELCRPFTSGLTSLAVAAAILIETGSNINLYLNVMLIAIVAVFLFSSAGNVLNDYFDRDIDKINHPERPLPSNRVKADDALKFSVVLFLLSLLLAFFLNFFCIIIAIIAFMFQIGYELKFKRHYLSKNFTIAFLTGMLFVFGGVAIKNFDVLFAISPSIIFAILAFLAIFGREIIKDIEDYKGDADRLTLPKKIGIKKSGIVAAMFLFLSVALSPVPYLILKFNLAYVFLVSITDLMFIYSLIIQFKNPKNARKIIKIGMLIALFAFIIGKF